MRKQIVINLLLDMYEEINKIDYIDKLCYIFTLLFLKVNMDTSEYKKKNYEKQYSKVRVKRLMETQPIIIKKTWKEIYENIYYIQFEYFLNQFLEDLEQINPCLKGAFSGIDFRKISYQSLINIMEKLNKNYLAIKNEEDKKEFINAIEEFKSNSKFEGKINPGEDFTPFDVAGLIAKLVNVKENEEVGDLVCGSGGLLLQTVKEIKNHKVQIYAQDKNFKMIQLCRLNILLHGIYDAKVSYNDIMAKSTETTRFDVIVGNPPFSTQNDIKKVAEENEALFYDEQYPYGMPPASKSDYAFIQKMLLNLKSDGRMTTIISLGALSRTGAEEEIRKNMIENNIIETIILLPQNLFRNTSIKTCIMLFNKNTTQGDVLFVNASNMFEKGKYRNEISNENIEKIIRIVQERKTTKGISYLATLKEVIEKNANLSVTKYVEENIQNINIEEVKQRIKKIEQEIATIEKRKIFFENKLREV